MISNQWNYKQNGDAVDSTNPFEVNTQKSILDSRQEEHIESNVQQNIVNQVEQVAPVQEQKKELSPKEKWIREYQNSHRSDVRAENFLTLIQGKNSIKKFKVNKIPSTTALTGEYKGQIKSLGKEQRAVKIMNKRSRLFKKAANSALIENAGADMFSENYEWAAKAASKNHTEISLATIRDLACFMDTDNLWENRNLVDMYAGASTMEIGKIKITEEVNGEEKEVILNEKQNRMKALDTLTAALMKLDVSKISMEKDEDVAKNAATLEKVSGMVSAYERLMADNPDYMESLKKPDYKGVTKEEDKKKSKDTFDAVTKRLDMLRALSTYYVARKELITDPYYRNHYNEELTMDVGENATKDQERIAKLLLNVYYAGRNFMRANGVAENKINKRVLNLKNQKARDLADKAAKLEAGGEAGIKAQRDLLVEHRKQSDSEADTLNQQLEHQRKDIIKMGKKAVKEPSYILEELDKNYKEPVLTQESLNEALDEFRKLDVNGFKFGSYKEALENFEYNLEYCRKADLVQTLVTNALVKGMSFSDDELLKLRAKIVVFNEVRVTLKNLSSFFSENGSPYDNGYDRWDEYMRTNSTRGELCAVPCKDMEKYYQKCLKQMTTEHTQREDTIKKMWRINENKALTAKMPKKLLSKKMDQYQKNAFLADFMSAQNDKILVAKAQGVNYINQLIADDKEIKESGFKFTELSRTAQDYLAGRSKEEVRRLIGLFSQGDEGKLKFWLEFYRDACSIDPSDFEAYPPEKFFENFCKKNIASNFMSNVNTIGDEIAKYAKKLGNKATAIFKEMEGKQGKDPAEVSEVNADEKVKEIVRKTKFLKDFGVGYMSGRFTGLSTIPSHKFRHAMSVEDFCGEVDTTKMVQLYDEEEAQKHGLEEMEVYTISKMQSSFRFTQMPISTRTKMVPKADQKPGEPVKMEEVYEYLKQDTDLYQLYKEDSAHYDVEEFKEKHKGGIKKELDEYNKGYSEYLKDAGEKGLYKEFDIKTGKVDEKDRPATIKSIEKAFETLLSFKPEAFSFKSYEELYSKDSFKLRHLAEVGSKAAKLYDFYEKQVAADEKEQSLPPEEEVTRRVREKGKTVTKTTKIKRTPKLLCTLNRNDLSSIKARIDFLATAKQYYGGDNNLMEFIEKDTQFTCYGDMQREMDIRRQNAGVNVEGTEKVAGAMTLDKLQTKRLNEEFTLGKEYFDSFSNLKNVPKEIAEQRDKVSLSITKLRTVLVNNRFPTPGTKNAKVIIDGTTNLVGVLYTQILEKLNQINDSVDKQMKDQWMGRINRQYYEPMSIGVKKAIEQCNSDREMFAQKAADYFELMSQNKVKGQDAPRLLDVLRFTRAEFYDTGAEGVQVKKGGANLSDISVIKSDKTGKTIYFRKEDFAPDADYSKAILNVTKAVYGDEKAEGFDTIRKVGNSFFSMMFSQDMRVRTKFVGILEKVGVAKQLVGKKDKKTGRVVSYSDVGMMIKNEVLPDIPTSKQFKELLNKFKPEDYEKLAQYFIQLRDMEYKKDVCSGQIGANIKPGRNLTNRHVATSRMSQILGIGHMVSASRTAQVNIDGQLVKGNLMEDSGGIELYDLMKKHKNEKISYSDEAVKQSLMLQVFDFMTGQVDRHFGNFHVIYDEKTKQITGIKAIDNDMCWGNLTAKDVQKDFRCFHALDDDVLKGLPQEFVNKIFAINSDNVRLMMGDILAPDEISDFLTRVDLIKQRFRKLAQEDPDISLIQEKITIEKDGENKNLKDPDETTVVSETIRYTGVKAGDTLRAHMAVKALMDKVEKENLVLQKKGQEKTSLQKKSLLHENLLMDKKDYDAMVENELEQARQKLEDERKKKEAEGKNGNKH